MVFGTKLRIEGKVITKGSSNEQRESKQTTDKESALQKGVLQFFSPAMDMLTPPSWPLFGEIDQQSAQQTLQGIYDQMINSIHPLLRIPRSEMPMHLQHYARTKSIACSLQRNPFNRNVYQTMLCMSCSKQHTSCGDCKLAMYWRYYSLVTSAQLLIWVVFQVALQWQA